MSIKPDWPAPTNIKAFCTTRSITDGPGFKGASLPPFDAFNLATHVGDDPQTIEKNRQVLNQHPCLLPNPPFWLDQQHTVDAVCLDSVDSSYWQPVVADASWTTQAGQVSVVMTADCIPILITNQSGSIACAIHAGWKGLADGIVSKTVRSLPEQPENLLVWIGPCIRQEHFEVGEDVYTLFCKKNPDNHLFFKMKPLTSEPKYLADLAGLLSLELCYLGVKHIYDSGLCSYENSEDFYSYRRDGVTGRMASLIWIEH